MRSLLLLALTILGVTFGTIAARADEDQQRLAFKQTWSAIERGEIDRVRQMLDDGTLPVDYQDPDSGWTMLNVAAQQNKREIVKLLLARGANPNLANRAGFAPVDSAMSNPGIIDLLVAAGARPPSGYRPLNAASTRNSPLVTSSPKAKQAKAQSPREKLCQSRWYASQALCSDSTCKMREARKWQTCLQTGSYY